MTPIVNAMSVDVEDYFQASAFDRVVSRADWHGFESRVVANTHRLLTLFDQHGVRATFFVLGWVAERFPALVREIAGLGHEVASHGFHHQLIYTLAPEQFREDVRRAKAVARRCRGMRRRRIPRPQLLGRQVNAVGARCPARGRLRVRRQHLPDSPRSVRHPGRAASHPSHRARGGRNRGGAWLDCSASARRTSPIAGGGYFRLLPYAWTKWGISRVNTVDQEPVVFYLHPWEIDPGQPRLPVGRTTRFRHYAGLDSDPALAWRGWCSDFRFDSIRSMLESESVVAGHPSKRRSTGVRTGEWAHAAK